MKKLFIFIPTLLLVNVAIAQNMNKCLLKYNNQKCLDETTLPRISATILLESFLNIPSKYDSLFAYHQSSLAIMHHLKAKDATEEDLKMILFML